MQIESVGQAGRALILHLGLGLGPLRCGGSGGGDQQLAVRRMGGARMNKLTGWLTMALVAALVGCGGNDEPGIDEAKRPSARAVIGPVGGTVTGEDRSRATVPEGALEEAVPITIAKNGTDAPEIPAGFAPAGAVFALEPHGQVFARAVDVHLPFDAAARPAGSRVAILKADPGGAWQLIEDVEVDSGMVTARVSDFSLFLPVFIPGSTPIGSVPGRPTGTYNLVPLDSSMPTQAAAGSSSSTIYLQRSGAPPQFRIDVNLPSTGGLALVCSSGTATLNVYAGPVRRYRLAADADGVARLGGYRAVRTPIATMQLDYGRPQSLTFSVAASDEMFNEARDPMPPGALPVADVRTSGNPDDATGVSVEVDCGLLVVPNVVPRFAVVADLPANSPRGLVSQPRPLTVAHFEPASYRAVTYRTGSVGWGWVREAPAGSAARVYAVDSSGNGVTNEEGRYAGARTVKGAFSQFQLTILEARPEDNGASYRFSANNTTENLRSQSALMTLPATYPPPEFLSQPQDAVKSPGDYFGIWVTFRSSPVPRSAFWEVRLRADAPWSRISIPRTNYGFASLIIPDEPSVRKLTPTTGIMSLRQISGAPGVTLAHDGMQFRAVVANPGGHSYSNIATLRVTTGLVAPTVITQPADTVAAAGSAVTLMAAADGGTPLSYQWYFNGRAIAGGSRPTLPFNAVNPGNAGDYQLEVLNPEGRVLSRVARLSITGSGSPPPSGLSIATQPASLTVAESSSAAFTVAVTGATAPRYQWQRNGADIAGATAASYAMAAVGSGDAGAYTVVIADGAVQLRSAVAQLNVGAAAPRSAPIIVTTPTGLGVTVGLPATLAVAASGSAPLAYQWQRNGVDVPNGTGPVLTFANTSLTDAGSYTVVVSNSAGQVTSNTAGLVVTPVPGAPSITTQPADRSVLDGQRATFNLTVSGNPAPQCLWTRNSAAIAGATSCTGYTTTDTTIADNGAVYNVVVYSPGGVAVGNGAVLTVSVGAAVPVITQDLADVTAPEGGTATFSVVASASGPLFHYWTRIGAPTTPLGGSSFDIGPLQASDDGATVRVIVCNGPIANNRCTTSRDARLTVTPAVPTNALTATQIVAGQEWSLVLRPDRSVWAWGQYIRNDGVVQYANLLSANQARRPVRMYPAALTDVRAISAWFNSFWALQGDPGSTGSRVLHWGRATAGSDGRGGDGNGSLGGIGNPGGQIAPRDNEAAPVEVLERVNGVPRPVDRVCAIAGGGEQLAMIRAISSTGATTDCNAGSAKTVWFVGSLLARGYDSTGVAFAMPGLPADSPPATIFTGKTTSGSPPLVVALEDGRLYGLGNNPYGGLGVAASGSGIVGDLLGPLQLPTSWGSPRGFGMSFYYSLFVVRADGSVMTSGYDNTGELGLGSVIGGSILGPRPVLAESCASLPCTDLLTGVTAIVATQTGATLALKNGQILAWGARDSNGLRGPGITAHQPFPRSLASSVTGFTALSASHAHALLIGPGNVVYAWGSGLRGALGDGVDGGTRTAPEMVTTP